MISIATGADVREFIANVIRNPSRFTSLLVCTPYVDDETIDLLVAMAMNARTSQSALRVLTLPAAARRLIRALPGHPSWWRSTVVPVPRLHAKVYLSTGKCHQDRRVIVTSANFTGPGLHANVELGISATPQTTAGADVFRETAAFIDRLIMHRTFVTTTPLHLRML